MLKTTEEYLREQSDLISFLAKIPAIQEFVRKSQEIEIVQECTKKLPNDLFEKYWLGKTFDDNKPLKNWIINNLEPLEVHFLIKHLKL